jgi:ribonuclease D
VKVITDTSTLEAYCDRAVSAEFLCVDTEFMRESTFYSQLCLIQVATPDEEFIIDPLAESIDLEPFLDLLADDRLLKVMHSARQDMEIFYDIMEEVPKPLFDTQIAAMALGFGDSVGYTSLVKGRLDINLDKGARFTDWSRRPLSEKQLNYAIGDVTHLRDLFPGLRDELERKGRLSWIEEETAPMLEDELYTNDPERAWKRLKIRSPKKPYLATLKASAAWREREAITRNIPRRRVLKDDALYAIAQAQPRSIEALGKLRGVPNGFERSRSAKALIEAIDTAIENMADYAPTVPRPKHRPPNMGPAIEMLRTLLRLRTEYEDIAPRLVANAADIEELAAEGEKADVAALKGWRREVFGADALALLEGKIALRLKGREVVAERL